jgi:hypothetical protein
MPPGLRRTVRLRLDVIAFGVDRYLGGKMNFGPRGAQHLIGSAADQDCELLCPRLDVVAGTKRRHECRQIVLGS